MAATLRELLIKVGFDIKKDALDKADKSVERLHKSVMWLATGIVAVSTALFGLVYSASKVGEEFAHMAEVTGINVETLQHLKEAANLADIDFNNLVVSVRYFGRTVGEAIQGQKMYTTYLRQAGIVTLRDQNGQMKSQIELLKEVADKIKNTTSVQEKLAILQNVLGRSGADLIALFNQGREGIEKYMGSLDDYGYVLSKVQIQAAATFDAQRKKLLMFVEGAKNAIGVALIPSFNKLIARLLELIKTNKELLFQKMIVFFKGLASIIKSVGLALYTFGEIVNTLVKSTIGWNRVLEIAGVLLGLLITNTVINSIKLLYTWIIKLAKGQGLLDAAFAPMEILLIAIAAAFYLAWDDLKNFEEGNLSLIGTLKKSHPIISDFIRILGELTEALKNIAAITFDVITEKTNNFLNDVKMWMRVIGYLIKPFSKRISLMFEHPSKSIDKVLKKTADSLDAFNKAIDPSKAKLGAQRVTQAAAIGAERKGATHITNNIEANITVPPGTPKDQQEWFKTTAIPYMENFHQRILKETLLASPLHEET